MRVVLLLAFLLALPAGFTAADDRAPCPGFAHVPGQGPSCPVPGGWLVLLAHGGRVLTHGADAGTEPPHADDLPIVGTRWTRVPVACAPDGQPRHALVYAHPSDVADRRAVMAPLLRQAAEEANGALAETAAAHGWRARLPFACEGDAPAVGLLALSRPAADVTFASVLDDARDRGLDDGSAKYWVFVDDGRRFGAGQATIHEDDRARRDNLNNAGPSYAVTYGAPGAAAMLHEALHTMGAVQHTAPHATGAWHCNDGRDVMCYADGGIRSDYSEAACPDETRVDCGGDDYFHPDPPRRSYLDTHWNVASRNNDFLWLERAEG